MKKHSDIFFDAYSRSALCTSGYISNGIGNGQSFVSDRVF